MIDQDSSPLEDSVSSDGRRNHVVQTVHDHILRSYIDESDQSVVVPGPRQETEEMTGKRLMELVAEFNDGSAATT